MNLHRRLKTSILVASTIVFLSILGGCNVANQNVTTKPMSINMQVAKTSSPKATANTTQAMNSVSLNNIKLLVKKLELNNQGNYNNEQNGDQQTGESEQENSDDQGDEVKITNQVLDLPVDGNKVSISTAQVPSGTYQSLEIKIGQPDAGSGIQDATLVEGDSDSQRYSMAISGTFNGNEFTFKSQKEFHIDMELNPPVEVTNSTQNARIDLKVNPSGWFKDPETGAYLDPSDPNNREVIESNIAHSFKADYHEESDHENDHEGDEEG